MYEHVDEEWWILPSVLHHPRKKICLLGILVLGEILRGLQTFLAFDLMHQQRILHDIIFTRLLSLILSHPRWP
jgi:hypothetical protein